MSVQYESVLHKAPKSDEYPIGLCTKLADQYGTLLHSLMRMLQITLLRHNWECASALRHAVPFAHTQWVLLRHNRLRVWAGTK